MITAANSSQLVFCQVKKFSLRNKFSLMDIVQYFVFDRFVILF